jgi:hypothetical protein
MFSICSTTTYKSQAWVVQGDSLVKERDRPAAEANIFVRENDGGKTMEKWLSEWRTPDAFNRPWSAIKPARNRADVRGCEQPAPANKPDFWLSRSKA